MEIKEQSLRIKGMQKDAAYNVFNPEFSFENKNIRITAIDSNNLLNVTNERGTKLISLIDITPPIVILYTYLSGFQNYLMEQIQVVYQYQSEFQKYLLEESDGGASVPIYTYNYSFQNYLIEQTLI